MFLIMYIQYSNEVKNGFSFLSAVSPAVQRGVREGRGTFGIFLAPECLTSNCRNPKVQPLDLIYSLWFSPEETFLSLALNIFSMLMASEFVSVALSCTPNSRII